MKQNVNIETKKEVLSLVTGVSFCIIPDWYDGTYRNLKMNLIIPKHRESHPKQPCLLFFCGGAYSVVDNAIWMPQLMYFAERGYTVATAEYRTSNHDIFPAQLKDAKAAVRYLKAHAEQFCINPDKIIVSGESAGGTMCSLLGTTCGMKEFDVGDYLEYSSDVAAVVDYYGVVDVVAASVLNNGEDGVQPWALSAFLGANYSDEAARKASAIEYVTPKTPPFMILHGTADPLVNIELQSDAFYDKLIANNVYTEYFRFEGAGHGEDVFYQEEVKERVLAFMNKVLNMES